MVDAEEAGFRGALGYPNGNVTSPDTGKIIGLAPSYYMRKMQFALRLDF